MRPKRSNLSAPSHAAPVESAAPVVMGVFCRQGEYWTITYEGVTLRLRDAKGLRSLAYLVRYPGKRVSALGLMEQVAEQDVRVSGGYGVRGAPSLTANSQHPSPLSAERARLAVTKRIKGAIQRIEDYDPALGYHLNAGVKTGAHCVYLPDPERPVRWRT